ncbi:NAD(P)H-dependent oxidoreductase [Streptomyces sp. DSM 41524]|uniref:NAD(P)H-dependent oxidoreductase n=1 Tax=Streptomyces asiaticus subsp. ignotus TaxID=3098222 RepID=A0ABU7Q8Y7_9ACTN|nr:NAD(P)H-dependent oxidoreductase [Streptomyces sp. DASNCL29]MEE4597847.1 NAD(P)H-dependent oxidoreductase [Streptomyces sp. DSM 41524]TMU93293.1 NAD(P)H-dependent oxidoreductase [Streptomyces sp. DASNCL29]
MTTDTAVLTATTTPASATDTDSPIRLAIIIGSTRDGRFGPKIADWFAGHAALRSDMTVDVVDLAETPLPTALTHRPGPEDVAALEAVTPRLDAADAFAVVTPEYNHSYPAPLKNAIDWHFTQWQAKPVGFVSYGGISGGLRAVEHLRPVFAEVHAVTVRDTVSFHNAGGLFGADGRLKEPEGPDTAAGAMLDQLTWWARALRTARATTPYGS